MLSTFLPVPAFQPKYYINVLKLGIVVGMESSSIDLNHFPAWVEVVFNSLRSHCLQVGVVLSDFHELEEGVTFVPEIEERVGIHQFLGLPLHLVPIYIIPILPFVSLIFSHLTISLPEFLPFSFTSRMEV